MSGDSREEEDKREKGDWHILNPLRGSNMHCGDGGELRMAQQSKEMENIFFH